MDNVNYMVPLAVRPRVVKRNIPGSKYGLTYNELILEPVVLLGHRTENDDIHIMTQEEKKQLKEDVSTLMELAFDGACIGKYEENLLNRIKENLEKL